MIALMRLALSIGTEFFVHRIAFYLKSYHSRADGQFKKDPEPS